MPLDKQAVVEAILNRLEADLALAISAAENARDTATSKENVAENKYDTLGLEAAYLAHGQSNRAQRLAEEKRAFAALSVDSHVTAMLGSLIYILDSHAESRWIFVGPGAAGLTLIVMDQEVVVVTPDSPLGAGLLGLSIGDVATINGVDLEIVDLL